MKDTVNIIFSSSCHYGQFGMKRLGAEIYRLGWKNNGKIFFGRNFRYFKQESLTQLKIFFYVFFLLFR